MDGQNMGNEQNNNTNQYSHYQDNTANVPFRAPEEISEPNAVNGLQIIGLICGIAGIVLGCCVGIIGIVLGIVGLICSIAGNKQGSTGVGTAGIICSIVAIVLGVISLILWVFGAAILSLAPSDYYYY